ncbi:MAG TPA: hypothetical protein PKI14_04445 [Fervidobacterium sp.]|nr:hypothetical protein [Fervidobacterium sp.]
MRLGIVMLNESSTVNDLKLISQSKVVPGSTKTIMFQLIDLDSTNKCPSRYIPNAGATITAKISSQNSTNTLNKFPVAAFAGDGSVFKFNLSTTETAQIGSVNLQITLTEGTDVKICYADSVIITSPNNPHWG